MDSDAAENPNSSDVSGAAADALQFFLDDAPVCATDPFTAMNEASETLRFEEGQRLYSEQRYSDAAQSWGQAVLLKHTASHAYLSSMLYEGRPCVGKDEKRAFELAAAGAALGCAHSKGALGRCYVFGRGVDEDVAKGLALGRESAAAGSCFGQFVVARCYCEGWSVAKDYAEALRLFCLAAAQGHANAQNNLGVMIQKGQGVAQDSVEAARLFRLAAAQGHAIAQFNLGVACRNGQGVAPDKAEAICPRRYTG